MKKLFLILGTFLLSLSTYAAMNVNKIDPPFWYAGMQNPELQLMVYGEDIGNSSVTVNYPGVSLSSTVTIRLPIIPPGSPGPISSELIVHISSCACRCSE